MSRPFAARRRRLGAAFTLAVAALTLSPLVAAAQPAAAPPAATQPAGGPVEQIVESSQVPDGVGPQSTTPARGGATIAGGKVAATGVAGAMSAGQTLNSGEILTSPNGRYTLGLQDGSLMVNRGAVTTFRSLQADYGRFTWGDVMRLQSDGNLVVYRSDGVPVWHTQTHGQGPAQLRLQDDGNLVLYSTATWKPLWNSGILTDVTRLSRETLYPGMAMYSPDGLRQLVMQRDGNLVLYRGSRPLWNSRTFVPGSRLVVDGGVAAVIAPDNRFTWVTPTGSGAVLVMQDDGNTVVYAPRPTWHSNTALPNCSTVTGPVPASETVRAANGVVVHPCLASSFNRMVADAAAQGVDLRGGGWRDTNVQVQLRIRNCGGNTEYNIWQKPSSQCNPPTAVPGRSMHERGLAIDFAAGGRSIDPSSRQFQWLSQNAENYGLKNLPSEPWHWSTNGW